MTDLIKIMDEIERDEISIFHEGRWQQLRTAIEAQAEELTQMKHMTAQLYQAAGAYDMPERVLDVLSDMASGDPLRHKNILPVRSPDTDEELAQARARIARLDDSHALLLEAADKHLPGLETLRHQAERVMYETDRQSLAAVKAEALREAADALSSKGLQFTYTYIDWLAQRANDIEREAKEL